jgi:hypothetical protein
MFTLGGGWQSSGNQAGALSPTNNAETFTNLLQLSKRATQAPAHNYWELKLNLATYMGLLFMLVGSQCDYYPALRQVYIRSRIQDDIYGTCNIVLPCPGS